MSSSTEQVLDSVEKVSKETFLGITWAAVWISFAFMIFRLSVRIRSFGHIQLDDYFVIVAWCMLLTSAIIWQLKAYVVYWLYAVQSGEVAPSADFLAAYENFMPQITTWNILFYSCLWAIKLSFLIFFRRLGSRTKSHVIWWWVVLGVTLIAWVGCIADIDWACSLNGISWIPINCPTPEHVLFENRTFYANMATDIVTDLLIISIPVVILRRVQLPLRKKAVLIAIFSASVLVMVMSIVRVTLVKGTTKQLQSASIDWLYLWSNVEAGIAIVIASVGSFRQLFVSSTPKGLSPGAQPSAPARSWLYRELFSRFTRLKSKNQSATDSQRQWAHVSNEAPWRSDSQANIVPLHTVHVETTYDVRSTPSSNALNLPKAYNTHVYANEHLSTRNDSLEYSEL